MQAALLEKFRAIVGPPNVLSGVELSPYVIEGRTPDAAVFPGSVDEVAAVVRLAGQARVPILPWGGGTATGVGTPPSRPGIVLGLRRLDRLVEHEPGDLTATVQAGLTIARLQDALRARGQWLSLDPADDARATVGGVIAANAAGPRRHLYGTVRDLLIGVSVVTADGAVVRGGGKVVKNVAGYDLPKLFIGAWGTLGIVVEATFKLRPLPDAERLLAVRFERLKDCGAAARAVLGSDLLPNALEILDGAAAAGLGLGPGGEGSARTAPTAAVLVIGFDGVLEQVEWQARELAGLVTPLGGRDVTPLPPAAWARLPAVAREAFDRPAAVMTLSVLPTLVAETIEQCANGARQRGFASAWAAHAGVGHVTGALSVGAPRTAGPPPVDVVHLALPAEGDTGPIAAVLGEWRAVARAGGGHATLTLAPLAVKSQVPVWDDAGAAARIMQRIKAQLDPHDLLNPGRFVAGI